MLLRVIELLSLRACPVLWVSRRRAHPDGFAIAVTARDGGCILLDPARGTVVRALGLGAVDDEQEAMRRCWSKYVSAPDFEVLAGGVVREEYIVGQHLSDLTAAEQSAGVRGLFESYAALTTAEAVPAGDAWLDELRRHRTWTSLPAVVRGALQEDLLEQPWPVVPTTTDTYSNNVVCREGGEITFLDCFPLRFQPFFAIPLVCIARWTRQAPHLLGSYLDGEFDPQLADLLAAGGRSTGPTPELRRFLMAASLTAVVLYGGDSADPAERLRRLPRRLAGRLDYYGLTDPAAWNAVPPGSRGPAAR